MKIDGAVTNDQVTKRVPRFLHLHTALIRIRPDQHLRMQKLVAAIAAVPFMLTLQRNSQHWCGPTAY